MQSSRFRLLCGLLPAVSVPFVAALFYFVICREPRIARPVYVGAKVFLLLWPLFVTFVLVRESPGLGRSARSGLKRACWEGVLTGTAISVFVGLLMLTPLGRLVSGSADSIRDRCAHLGIMSYYWLFSVFLSLVHSLIEEYYWRGFVYGQFRRIVAPTAAAFLSAAAFGSHHVIITGRLMNWPLGIVCGVGITAGGVIWAFQYNRHRSLLAPWISHAIVDFAVMTIGYWILTSN